MGFISGVVSHIVDTKLEHGLSKAAKKAAKKGDVLEAKAIMFILEGSQRAKQEEKAKKTEVKAQKEAKRAGAKVAKEKAHIQRTSKWGEEMTEVKSSSQAFAGSTPLVTSTSSKSISSKPTFDQSALQGILGKIEKVREEVEEKVEQAVREGKLPEQDHKILISQIANRVYLRASDEKRKARSSSLDTNRITQLISGEVEKVVSARQAKIEREGAIKEAAERKAEQERQKELKKEQRQADFDRRMQEASELFESGVPRDTRFPLYESAEAASQAQARCQAMGLPPMPDVTSSPKFEPQTSIWEDRKVEVLPSNPSDDIDAIAEHVKAYNIATVLAVVFIGLTILLGIPFGFIPLLIALEMLAKRSEEREAVEQIEHNYSIKNWGKNYYKALKEEKSREIHNFDDRITDVKKPEFHWWGATRLQFV
ncbi:MAG: hypothetical protein K940chlam8_00316 [Chlamydiae bacterium]|nr:hypothetical protein [Chlamydiota bacterium]